MSVQRSIGFSDVRPGDRIILRETNGYGRAATGASVTVASVGRGKQIRFRIGPNTHEVVEPITITSIFGGVYTDTRLTAVGDPADGIFRRDTQWNDIKLVVEDDREALLQDLEEVLAGDPGYDDPEGQCVFSDALERVIAAAQTTLGPGLTRSARCSADELMPAS